MRRSVKPVMHVVLPSAWPSERPDAQQLSSRALRSRGRSAAALLRFAELAAGRHDPEPFAVGLAAGWLREPRSARAAAAIRRHVHAFGHGHWIQRPQFVELVHESRSVPVAS